MGSERVGGVRILAWIVVLDTGLTLMLLGAFMPWVIRKKKVEWTRRKIFEELIACIRDLAAFALGVWLLTR